jgi:hypothetical protein
MPRNRVPLQPDIGAERTAEILIERMGAHAFDFAAKQAALLSLADDKRALAHWRAIARAIEDRLKRRPGPA